MTTIDMLDSKEKLKKDYKSITKENIDNDIIEGIDFLDYILYYDNFEILRFRLDTCNSSYGIYGIKLYVQIKGNEDVNKIYNFTFENSRFYTFKDIVEMRDYIITKIEKYER